MSDSSNSTGSTGSSTNSWTLLSPEEAAIGNVGPVDDGTESLGDAPSLSEDVAGASADYKPAEIPIETILSEEGHQICQETSPESSEGPVPSSPPRMSPLPPLDPPDLDLESQAPVIHDIVASSPSDNEPQGVMSFITNIDLGAPLDIPPVEIPQLEPEGETSESPFAGELDAPADSGPIPSTHVEESHACKAEPRVHVPTETLTATDLPSHTEAEISFIPDSTEPPSTVPESLGVIDHPGDESLTPETVGSAEIQVEEVEEAAGEEISEPATQDEREDEEGMELEPSSSFELGDTSSVDDGLRRRNVPSFDAPRPRTSDEEDEEEEVEFKLAEKKEEKPWFSMNTCVVAALVLLFLGSLFLSGDFEGSEVSDGEQSQDELSGDPQDMKALLDKLTQENQQITQLEAQLQTQKEELDSEMKAVAASGDEKGTADLEKENAKLKEELTSLPALKKELESLRVRVTELSQLTAELEIVPATSTPVSQPDENDAQISHKAAGPERSEDAHPDRKLKEELQRQKLLLEESRKRLEGMKKGGSDRKQVRDNLQKIQRELSEHVEKWRKKKPQESKWKGNKGKHNDKDHWKKEEKREWKHSKDGRPKEREEKEREWKPQKQNSHKEAWRKHQDEWDRKKGERRMDREERRKEKPWHGGLGKNSQHHQPQHPPPRQSHHHHHDDFWRDQEQKLQGNVRPQLGCSSIEDCAGREGLYPVELPEFEELLEGYLSKLQRSSTDSKDKVRKLTADFFEDGVFIHDRVRFSDFAEDVADVLEDMVDVLEGGKMKEDDSLEEEMEEFEREAMWKFAATA
ncbi:pre-B-cell leukemia transcription factor-interacting protein 1 isoform X1 [Cololabis saira]|uniref:pre-B-cell leukemia transcription factor-interacting protein 1 isoform X1 n=1 Tax=Cololabis saira TaxID=129043 RepID=UPI002AD49057|nr:pre-B-cell leukemia transcription factor-interacting protein 1 isoform X1 [Cololabis saira]